MQIFPESVTKLWNQWELRGMVFLSLCLQIVLIICGNRRKYTAKKWVGIFIWIAYLSADWVATFSLGVLSNTQANSTTNCPNPSTIITAFWAPFLLMHLGGPDSITAYSLEDNELWLRHLLSVVVQIGLVFYVILRSWTQNPLMFLAIMLFLSGIFKCGERTWVLWSASSQHFRDSLLPAPDPRPDYAKFVENCDANLQGGMIEKMEPECCFQADDDEIFSQAKLLHEAYFLFQMFKRLYSDLILSFHERQESMSIFEKRSSEDSFKLIEIELGFMYDMLYSKASIVYSKIGLFLRSLGLLSSVSAFVAFWVAVNKHVYSKMDVTMSYLLLIGAIFLEIYAVIVLIFSDWTILWLSKHKKKLLPNLIYRVLSSTGLASINRKRWSGSMAQYNLIEFFLNVKRAKYKGIQKFLHIYEMLEKARNRTWVVVTMELKKLILLQLLLKTVRPQYPNEKQFLKQLCSERGDYVLERKNCLNKFSWSVVEVEFDHSVLLWHIATDLCYYSDLDRNHCDTPISNSQISKSLSDYILYLVVMCPSMLPKGIGQIRYHDTCADAMRFFSEKTKIISSTSEACRVLLQVNTEIHPDFVKGDRSKSLLFDGCRLAKALQSLETEEQRQNEGKWEMISQVWVEMLSHAAIQCGWNHHAQQLRLGGELLTHVCLLIAHLGFSEQFQIFRGHTRM